MTDSFHQKGGVAVNESGAVAQGTNTVLTPSETFVREDGSYAPYEYWMSLWGLRELYAYGLRLLGDLEGRDVLDCGCGRGHVSVMLAKRGARVTAFDTAKEELSTAEGLARANGVQVKFLCEAFEELSLPDESFDLLFGTFVLHHVDLSRACLQIKRVLKPGGRAVFVENSALNPLLMAARTHICGRFGVARYGDDHEHPLTRNDIAVLKAAFPDACQVHFPSLLLFRLLDFYVFKRRSRWLTTLLEKIDGAIGQIPAARKYGYLQIIHVWKAE
jgi:SAM-dependent methyltransferase